MIYLKESFNRRPASPAIGDDFVRVIEDEFLPSAQAQDARLVGSWFAHEEWYSHVIAWLARVANQPGAVAIDDIDATRVLNA